MSCNQDQRNVTLDGMIVYLFGPLVGKRHDACMLAESRLMNVFQGLVHTNGSSGLLFLLYGDLAPSQSIMSFGGFLNLV